MDIILSSYDFSMRDYDLYVLPVKQFEVVQSDQLRKGIETHILDYVLQIYREIGVAWASIIQFLEIYRDKVGWKLSELRPKFL